MLKKTVVKTVTIQFTRPVEEAGNIRFVLNIKCNFILF